MKSLLKVSMKNKISFQYENFDEFFEKNKDKFIKMAEKETKEKFNKGLLTIKEIRYLAQDYWDNYWNKQY
jgi:hypothetical protein